MERFHGTLRPDFLDEADPFTSIEAAIDAWVAAYNAERPHQALDDRAPGHAGRAVHASPPGAAGTRGVVAAADAGRHIHPTSHQPEPGPELESGSCPDLSPDVRRQPTPDQVPHVLPAPVTWSGGPIEFDQVVPASGNMRVARKQFWLAPARAGMTVRFWASTDVIHLSIGGARSRACGRT